MLENRSFRNRLIEARRVLRKDFSRWQCYHCWRDSDTVHPFWLPFGSKGAVAPFCCACFQTASVDQLRAATRDMLLNLHYVLDFNGLNLGEVLAQAINAIEFLLGVEKKQPFENPYFEKDSADFPSDPTAKEGVRKYG